MKRIITIIIFLTAVLSGCTDKSEMGTKSLSIVEDIIFLVQGESRQLTLVNPDNMDVQWESSNPDAVICQKNGTLIAVSAGQAYITATANGFSDICKVCISATEAKAGDYFYSDGTYSTELHAEKEVIGIVFQTDLSRIAATEQNVLKSKGIDTPHGLVMSVKNAAERIAWTSVNSPENIYELRDCKTAGDCADDIKGLYNYNAIKKLDEVFSDYPAFKAVAEFDIPAPENTTGWYVPAIGQLYDFFANIGGLLPWEEARVNEESQNYFWMNQVDVITNINEILSPLGEGNYDRFITDASGQQYLWSSSEVDYYRARDFVIHTNGLIMCYWNYKRHSEVCDIRPILAF